MSREEVALVQRGYEAYAADGIEELIPFLDPDVDWTNPPDSPIAGVSRARGSSGVGAPHAGGVR